MEPARRIDGMSDATAGRRAVIEGALLGAALILPITVAGALVDRAMDDFDDSSWPVTLFLLVLVAYAVAGWWAGRQAGEAPLTNGALAGLGAFAAWVPLRVLIWLVRDDSKGLVSGDDAVFTAGGLLGNLVFAAALGMAGALVAGRRARRRGADAGN
jgi:putative membrane protein (TIGR04086 family)